MISLSFLDLVILSGRTMKLRSISKSINIDSISKFINIDSISKFINIDSGEI